MSDGIRVGPLGQTQPIRPRSAIPLITKLLLVTAHFLFTCQYFVVGGLLRSWGKGIVSVRRNSGNSGGIR